MGGRVHSSCPAIMTNTVSGTGDPRKDYTGEEISEGERIAIVFVGLFEIIVGGLGNVAIFITVLKTRSMRSPHYFFMANLAVGDLILTGYTLPYQMLGLILYYYPVFSYVHCQINAFATNVAFCASTFSLAVISLNRYLHVCHSRIYTKVFSTGYACSLTGCGIIWLLSILLVVPGFFNDGGFDFDVKGHYCNVMRAANNSFYLTLVIVSMGIPTVVICFCNFAIWRFVRQASHRIYAATRGMANNNANKLNVPKLDVDTDSASQEDTTPKSLALEGFPSMQQSDWTEDPRDQEVKADETSFAPFDTTALRSSQSQPKGRRISGKNKTQTRYKVTPLITPDELALMKSLLSVSVCFLTFMAPYLVTIFADPHVQFSSAYYIGITQIVYMNFCVNCVLYGITIPRFRRAMIRSMLCCVFSSNGSV